MAFIDTGVSGYGGLNPGAPSGSGVNVSASASAIGKVQPGSNGMGSNMTVRSWSLFYLGFIIVVLVATGILFNNKGRG